MQHPILLKEILSPAFQKTKAHFGYLAALQLIAVIIISGLLLLAKITQMPGFFISILQQASFSFFSYLITITALQITDGKTPSFSDLSVDWRNFFFYFAITFSMSVAIMLGFFLFLIPGCLFSIWWVFTPFLAIENREFTRCFSESKALTQSQFWQLAWIVGILFLILLGGVLAAGVGVFFTFPMMMIAYAELYRKSQHPRIHS